MAKQKLEYRPWRNSSLIRDEDNEAGLVVANYEMMKSCEELGPSGLVRCSIGHSALSLCARFMGSVARDPRVELTIDRFHMDVRCRECNRLNGVSLPFRTMSQTVLLWRNLVLSLPGGTSISLRMETESRGPSGDGVQVVMDLLT